ncbi:hypothetical protein [Epibacterium ulvae]|uniref:COG3904 family protein n=1 Tax=Epibacterium ulvae TaxID=1156985 RepID=UPI00248FA512|nr:hypothetical protein [Epibacterium ulvae]
MAQGTSWNTAIQRVERSSKEYFDYAVDVGGTSWAGSAYNGYQFDRHLCAIVGRMLEQVEAIKEIENLDYPPMNATSDAHDLLVFSISLENWTIAARRAVDMNRDERINVWNLDCVGEMGIPANLFMESAQPNAAFDLSGQTLLVYGDIEEGFFDRLKSQLDANPQILEIALGSGGGSVRDALLSGYEIRRRGLSTTIYGNCFSACPLVFMGGETRVLWASPSRLGFHQIYTGDGKALPVEDPIYSLTTQYMAAMGVNPQVIIPWMLSARPDEMFEPEVSDLCAPGVATFVQRVCGW